MTAPAFTRDEEKLLAIAATTLAGGPFDRPDRWPLAVVIVRLGERPRVTSRSCFASWLAANDLRSLARECIKRKVPSGSVLFYFEADSEVVATARFAVVDVRGLSRRWVASEASRGCAASPPTTASPDADPPRADGPERQA